MRSIRCTFANPKSHAKAAWFPLKSIAQAARLTQSSIQEISRLVFRLAHARQTGNRELHSTGSLSQAYIGVYQTLYNARGHNPIRGVGED
jgi:hypothetical protein